MYTGAFAVTGQLSLKLFAETASLSAKLSVAAASGFASGGVGGGTLQSAIRGAVTAMAFAGVGQEFAGAHVAEQIAAHAVVGCVSSELSGGNCGSGALAAGFAKGVSAIPGVPTDLVGGTIATAISGGIGEVIGGGKFANGAVTGAFGYLFNRYDDRPDDKSVSQLGAAPKINVTQDDLVNFSAGLGDGVTLFATRGLRSLFDIGSVNTSASAYIGGAAVGAVATGKVMATAGLYAAAPATLYHFTTAASAGAIARSGVMWAATSWTPRAIYGAGVYATSINNAGWAMFAGAASTQATVVLATQNLMIARTIFPFTYRILSGASNGIKVVPKP